MTMFKAARKTTKYLIASLDEGSAAGWANFLDSRPAIFPAITDTARWASGVSAACLFSAIHTVLRVFRRAGNGMTMNYLMARDTYRHAVIYVKGQLRIIREWLDVMGVQIVSAFTALLAGVVVTRKNIFSPFRQLPFQLAPLSGCRCTALPDGRRFSRSPFADTFGRAKGNAGVAGIELFPAGLAWSKVWLAAMQPARFRTVFCGVGAVLLNGKRCAAHDTFEGDLRVLHTANYTTQQ